MKTDVSALSIDDELDIIPIGEEENQTPTESVDSELDIVPFESQQPLNRPNQPFDTSRMRSNQQLNKSRATCLGPLH